MAHNEAMAERVRQALANRSDVEEKRMFRGTAFMVDGKMCVSVGDERMMCRIDPAMHAAALKRKGAETVVMKGREYRGFIYVHAHGMKSEKDFRFWIGLALEFNPAAKSSKAKPSRAKPSGAEPAKPEPPKATPRKRRVRDLP